MPSFVLSCWKCTAFTFVVLHAVSGLTLGSVLSYVLINRYDLRYFFGTIRTPMFSLYAPAVLILLTAVVGWKAMQKRHALVLRCFAVLLMMTIFIEIGLSVWCYASKGDVPEKAAMLFGEKFKEAQNDPSKVRWWDNIQSELICCGVLGPQDYHNNRNIPFSCCGSDVDHREASCTFIHQKGCLDLFVKATSKDLSLLCIVGISIAAAQVGTSIRRMISFFGKSCKEKVTVKENFNVGNKKEQGNDNRTEKVF